MRRRMVRMAIVAVALALVLVGVPLSVYGANLMWTSADSNLDTRVQTLARAVERRLQLGDRVDENMLTPWIDGQVNLEAEIEVTLPWGEKVTAGDIGPGRVLRSETTTVSGAIVMMEVRASDVLLGIVRFLGFGALAALVAFVISVSVASHIARRLSAPLIYLAAAAEQLGAGQTRPRVRPSGIEEIDLVQAELVRSADRMAGRLAAERQFAADASHQLRTPLTALSMRLEEIEYLSDQEDVKDEARACLTQVERLTGVVQELLSPSRNTGGTTEAVDLDEVFDQQREEWAKNFEAAGRELAIENSAHRVVLASPGSIAQVLATLIENSLKYGAGTTRVTTRPAPGRGVFIDVADEGSGITPEDAEHIFEKGFSTGGSTGIGLPLARDLVSADGGRLELTQNVPAVFTIFLNGLPSNLNPQVVLPRGNLIAVGRRRQRR